MILTVYLSDGEQSATEVPITPETTCRDVVEFCKEPGEGGCHLAEVWRGNGERERRSTSMLTLCGSSGCYTTQRRLLCGPCNCFLSPDLEAMFALGRASNSSGAHDVRPPAEVGPSQAGSEVLPPTRGLAHREQRSRCVLPALIIDISD